MLEFFDDEIERLKSMDRLGYASVHVMTKSRLNKYMGETDQAFEDIDLNFIRKFEAWMIKRGIAVTTRSIDLRTFRTVWRNAIKEKLCKENHYPFRDFAFSNTTTRKRRSGRLHRNSFKKLQTSYWMMISC